MSWTSGTWADVAIGDTVLGGDGYAWSVTNGLINHFGPSGKGEYLRVTMTRPIIGRADAERDAVRTGDVFADKPIKYREGEGVRRIISCVYCLRSDVEDPCKLHAPEPATETCPGCRNPLPAGHKFPYCSPCIDEAEGESTSRCGSAGLRHLWDADPSDPWPTPITAEPKPAAPYVEYNDAERSAAAALKSAGFTMEVIERVMTLDGLAEHILDVHGHDVPGQNKLTRIEYRARLADLHFDLHLRGQERNRKWEPRGRTPHVHPVMDRPMDAA